MKLSFRKCPLRQISIPMVILFSMKNQYNSPLGHSSGAWSDRNSNADTACTQGDPGEQQDFQSKEAVCYEEIKEDVQKSIFALKRAKAIAEKIHGWGFDTYSMNDCKTI